MKATFFHDSILKWSSKDRKYYTNGGLTNVYLQRYLKYFDNLTLVTRKETLKPGDNLAKMSVSSGSKINFDCIDSIGAKAIMSGTIKKKVRCALKNTDFAIIRLPSVIGIFACAECNRMKKPYVVEMVGSPFCSLWYYGKISYKLIAPLYTFANKHCVGKAQNVIYVTSKYLQKYYPNHNNSVGISDVNIEEFDSRLLEKRKNKILSYTDKTIYKIGLIGSMDVKFKGHDIAIKSIPLLKQNGINVEMHFLGKCSDHSKNRLLGIARKYDVSDNIFVDGVLSGGKAVYKWIDDKDIIILPSKQEGLPRALVESMSRAAICIGARTGGIPELLTDNCIMNRRNAVGLAETICKTLADKHGLIMIAENNYKNAKKFSYYILEGQLEKYYKKILDNMEEEK